MKKLFLQAWAALICAAIPLSNALAGYGSIRVDDFRNTNGAAGRDLNQVMQKQVQTGQSALDLIFIGFTLAGVVISGICLIIIWKASKEEGREKPVAAIVGLVMGGCLTILGLVVGLFANTVAV